MNLYNHVRKYFDEKHYVDLIVLINTINSWNRLSISMGNEPGHYQRKENVTKKDFLQGILEEVFFWLIRIYI